MSPATYRQKAQEEISLIPEERIGEFYELARSFRIRARASEHPADRILSLAGSWSEMTEADFVTFRDEITDRRRQAGGGRRRHEARLD